MIDRDDMVKLANETIETARNNDWKNRGELILKGEFHQHPVLSHNGIRLGNSTSVFFEFEKPLVDSWSGRTSSFVGFVLSVMKVGKKVIREAKPVIGEIKSDDYTCNRLSHRFCPQCNSLDSITNTSRRLGEECVRITYKCRECSYKDIDILD